MPTYDYRCETCDHTFEFYQSFSEDPLTKCPQDTCSNEGGGTVKKIFSTPGISFKGSGFYKNDNRSKSSSSSNSKSSDSATTGSDSSSADSKAKPSSGNSTKSTPTSD